jgi:uncharacterized phage-like protein YoqJ
MIIGVSGHRSVDKASPAYSYVRNAFIDLLADYKPAKVITGMALGFDTLVAEVCIEKSVPFIAAVPYKGQELFWSKEEKNHYFDLLEHADLVEIVSPGGHSSWKYQHRNMWICNNSDMSIVCFDGSPSGTRNYVEYALSKKKEIIRINPLNYAK